MFLLSSRQPSQHEATVNETDMTSVRMADFWGVDQMFAKTTKVYTVIVTIIMPIFF